MSRIYLSAPHMGQFEEGFVAEAFRTNWLSSVGPNLDAFEADIKALSGAHAVALSSGTAAIHLALRLLGVGAGDEVLCPSLTFAASANPIVYQGASPVFLDSDASYNIDPNVLETALTKKAAQGKRPKAIMVVHLFGQSADLDPIFELGARFDVPVIEDAAEALGTLYKGKQVGALGGPTALGVYSFNGNKIITTSGGGALISRNQAWVDKARFWSTQSRDPGLSYEHSELGYNYRMSNVLAGIGRGQLAVLEDRVQARRAIAFRYRDAFADLEGMQLMPEMPWGRHTYWLSVIELDETKLGIARDELVRALAKLDIEARPVWKPMHLQKFFSSAECYGGDVAERLYSRGICLPSSSSLSESDQGRVIEALRAAVRN